jgi:exosortase/archaeosortase family protein
MKVQILMPARRDLKGFGDLLRDVDAFKAVKGVIGLVLVVLSLVILRYFMLAQMDLGWITLIAVGVVSFSLGSRLLVDNVTLLRPYRDMWAVFSVVNVFAWLIHAGQVDELLANSSVGSAFASLTIAYTGGLLKLSGVPVTATGEVLYLGPQSRIGAVAVTGLCSGFLSFAMFLFAFSLVLVDTGKTLGPKRLIFLLAIGASGTFLISSLRVYLVLVVGYYFGLTAMATAHQYLGYVMFLCLCVCFWYATLEWSRRLRMKASAKSVGKLEA